MTDQDKSPVVRHGNLYILHGNKAMTAMDRLKYHMLFSYLSGPDDFSVSRFVLEVLGHLAREARAGFGPFRVPEAEFTAFTVKAFQAGGHDMPAARRLARTGLKGCLQRNWCIVSVPRRRGAHRSSLGQVRLTAAGMDVLLRRSDNPITSSNEEPAWSTVEALGVSNEAVAPAPRDAN
jgi:hypothetical protein